MISWLAATMRRRRPLCSWVSDNRQTDRQTDRQTNRWILDTGQHHCI